MVKHAATGSSSSSSTNGSHCQNCRNLKAKIREQIGAFKILTKLTPGLRSEVLIKNVEELLGKPCDSGASKCGVQVKQLPTSQSNDEKKIGQKNIVNSEARKKQKVLSGQNAMCQGGGRNGTKKKKIDMIKRKYSKGPTKRILTHKKVAGRRNGSSAKRNKKSGEAHLKNMEEPRRSQRQVKPRRKSSPSPNPPSLSEKRKQNAKYGRGMLNPANFFDSHRQRDDDDDDDGMPTLRTHDVDYDSASERSYHNNSGPDGNESDDWSSGPDEWFSAAELQGIPYNPPDAHSGDDEDVDDEEEEEMGHDDGAGGMEKPISEQINRKIRQLVRMEGQSKITVYQCKVCSKSFERQANASRHVRRLHFKMIKSCPFCNRVFYDNQSFVRHEPICQRVSEIKQGS